MGKELTRADVEEVRFLSGTIIVLEKLMVSVSYTEFFAEGTSGILAQMADEIRALMQTMMEQSKTLEVRLKQYSSHYHVHRLEQSLTEARKQLAQSTGDLSRTPSIFYNALQSGQCAVEATTREGR